MWGAVLACSLAAACGAGPARGAEGRRRAPVDRVLEARAMRIEAAVLTRCILPDGYFVWYTLAPDLADPRKRIRPEVWPNWPNRQSLFAHFEPERHPEFGPEVYHLGFQGPVPSPSSSCENAWLGLLAHELGLDPEGARFARSILDRLDETNLNEVWDTRGDLPPEIRWRSEIVLTEALGIWLSAYWKGRLLEVW